MTTKALWMDGRSLAAWVKADLKLYFQGRLQSRASYGTRRSSQETAQHNGSRHMHSAGITSEAIADLKNRVQQGITRGSYTYVKVLQTCSKQKDFLTLKQVHQSIIESGMGKNPYVANTLLDVYIKCGRLLDARQVFDEIERKSVITWNKMIVGYAKRNQAESALELFKLMRQQGVRPDEVTYLCILKACTSPLTLDCGKEIHGCIRHAGFESDVRVGTALLQMYARCGCIMEARRVFDRMQKRTVVTWNIMISGLAQHGCGHEAYRLFLQMKQEGFEPDSFTYTSVLNACRSAGALEWGKDVHAQARDAGLESDVRLSTSLIQMYAKSGSIDDARNVFNRIGTRDVVTWNIMISGLAQHGCGHEAYRLFLRMKQEGFKPDAFTYTSSLRACASAGALEWGKEIHGYASAAGLALDMRVGTSLVDMYAKSGSIDSARLAFDRMTTRDVVTWNTMISGLAQHGCGHEAYSLFLQMKQEGFQPDAFTYASVLNACASAGALEWGKEVHDQATKAGLELDVRLGNSLVHMYVKSGSIDDARVVFDRMGTRDVVTWNTMISGHAEHGCAQEAYKMYLRMRRDGFEPDEFTYASILNACASAGAMEWGKEAHRHASEAGLELDVRVGTSLVDMYAKSGSLDDARLVFDRMGTRDVVTWNVMITGLAEHGCGHEAYRLFLRMNQEGFAPNAFTYTSVLSACASARALELGKEVHGHARKSGLELDVRLCNSLVDMYAKSGSIDDARLLFDRMGTRDVVTWNIMISGLAQHGCGHEAYRLFLQMRQDGFEADEFTYTSVLNACASAGALEWGKEVHGHARKSGLESDVRLSNSLVDMYAKSGSISDARLVFDRMRTRDVITWNVMISGLVQHGCGHEAYRLFLQMRREGFQPDEFTYTTILNACASAGSLDWGKEVHGHATEAGLESNVRVGTSLVHMYAKSGSIDDARLVFNRMEKRDVVTWNTLMSGLAQHGCGLEALKLFRKMNADRVKPNGTTFVTVLSACSHAGLVDDGRRLFSSMTESYGIEHDIVHYSCMVDILGRAGQLEEARRLISDMPVEPDAVTWTALLGACRTYGNVELGELVSKELFRLEPNNASTYVLLCNIYGAAGKWDKVSLVRSMMQKAGVRKEPGRSWIEVNDKIHEFVSGDTSHIEAKEIKSYLKTLTEELKAEGYIPDTQLVLQNINDEDKKLALCSHSEKLAIAYGLMHIPRGEVIRVCKNLRVCPDCHTATKLVTKVTGREIIARDANRFHHFKEGMCSCGDYW